MLPQSNFALKTALAEHVARPNVGLCVVTACPESVIDNTSITTRTMGDLCRVDYHMLVPVGAHTIKSCGVTVSDNMVGHVVEKQILDLWSQHHEVGTYHVPRSQPMSAIRYGADVGRHLNEHLGPLRWRGTSHPSACCKP